MANAFLNLARTTTCPDVLRRILTAAQLPTNAGAFRFLGTDDVAARRTMVELIKHTIRDVKKALPQLGRTDVELTLTAGQRYVLLPTTLWQAEIHGVYWGDDEPNGYAGQMLDFWPTEQLDRMESYYTDPNTQASYPIAWSISPINQTGDRAAINLHPIPSAERTIRVVLRTADTDWTIADLNDAEAEAVVTAGVVTSITVNCTGENYTTAPTVTISSMDKNGSGATGTAVLTGTRVTSVTVTAGGGGYTDSDSVIVQFSGGRSTCSIPDDLMELVDYLGAARLQEKNTGNVGGGIAAKELMAKYQLLLPKLSVDTFQTNQALKHNYIGYVGSPRPGVKNPFGALGCLGRRLGGYRGDS